MRPIKGRFGAGGHRRIDGADGKISWLHGDNPPIWRTISAILLLTLATGCAGGGRSQWDYYSPEHVQCADIQIKLCRQYGPHLICGCRKK